MVIVPDGYIGREQTFLKHEILRRYLLRLFMIIGRTEKVVNYVDCFAGPWSEESAELRDTSIGISIEQMEKAAETLRGTFHKEIEFRAFYIEKDPAAYRKLSKHINALDSKSVSASCRQGDYTDLIPEIEKWIGHRFTFFFVDPKGWKQINSYCLERLLLLPNTEFLINFMYDFINRSVSIDDLKKQIEETLGACPTKEVLEDPDVRKEWILDSYLDQLNAIYGGRTASAAIDRPGVNRVLYFLVYLTRHPLGSIVFMQEAEKLEGMQKQAHYEARLRKQIKRAPMDDMFGIPAELDSSVETIDLAHYAKEYLLSKLSIVPTLIDYECWASFLEESRLFESDLQSGMKALVRSNLVENIDADVSKRRVHIVKPSRSVNSERWKLLE